MTTALACEGCGAAPCPSESPGTGEFEEDGVLKFICLACWCAQNYGCGAVETLEAKRQQANAKRSTPSGGPF